MHAKTLTLLLKKRWILYQVIELKNAMSGRNTQQKSKGRVEGEKTTRRQETRW